MVAIVLEFLSLCSPSLSWGIFHEGHNETVAKKVSEPAGTFGPVWSSCNKMGQSLAEKVMCSRFGRSVASKL